jgi:hypothetical protein
VRAFVDEPITDLERARALAQRAATAWGLPDPVLIRQSMCAIFRCGDAVIRVSRPNSPASALLDLGAVLADSGVRVPQPLHRDVVEDGAIAATAWEYLAGVDEPIDWVTIGSMVRRVHGIDPVTIPKQMPAPSPAVFPWWDFDTMFVATAPLIDEGARHGIRDAIERRRGWSDFEDTVLCHGDVHPGNVIMTDDGPVLIDWDLLCTAPAAWDHGPLMTWSERWGGMPGTYESFADGYGWSARGDADAEAFAELRLVAATLMRVQAAQRNPDAVAEADARLRYWRGEPQAPQWRAQ